jgi:hypothetical protein
MYVCMFGGVIVSTVARELAYEVCLCVYVWCVEESYKHVCIYVCSVV